MAAARFGEALILVAAGEGASVDGVAGGRALAVPTLLMVAERGVIGTVLPPLHREHVPRGEFASFDAGHLGTRDPPVQVQVVVF